jgi:hypothetical protein
VRRHAYVEIDSLADQDHIAGVGLELAGFFAYGRSTIVGLVGE